MIVNVDSKGRGTTVEVGEDLWVGDERLVVVGVGRAVCARDDHYVRKIGERVAFGRALLDFGRQTEEIGRRMEEMWAARAVTKAELAERKAAKGATRKASR